MGFFDKLKKGLSKTKEVFTEKVQAVVSSFTKIDEDLLEELEETMILSDVGMATTEKIIFELRAQAKAEKIKDPSEITDAIRGIVRDLVSSPEVVETYPKVMLVVGVNGVGKTTSIGKIANFYKSQGQSVLLAAADTFRAAASEQLSIWADRNGVPIVKYAEGHDPAAVVYDALDSAKHKNIDVVLVDTAGRLHNKKNLMNELSKINRVIEKEYSHAMKETLLVLDATTGQNAISQAKEFKNVADVTGIVLTKLDGTAKGGVVLAVKEELGVGVRFIGVGEGIDDLQPFDAQEFADALF